MQNFIRNLLDVLKKMEEGLKSDGLGLTEGQSFLVLQLTSQVLRPVIEILSATEPYLSEASPREPNIDLLPDEFLILIKGLQKRAKEKDATAAEIAMAAVIKDVWNFFDSLDDNQDKNESRRQGVDVTKEEVQRLIGKLLTSQPSLKDLNNLSASDFNESTKLFIESNLGQKGKKLDAELITDALYPYLDQYSWNKIEAALEEIIQDPASNKFLYKNMTNSRSPWYHATMGLLSSRGVKFNGFGKTLASAAGLGSLVDMWKVAQRLRGSEDSRDQQPHIDMRNSLSSKSKNMLTTATNLLLHDVENEKTATESLLRCLKLSGLITRTGSSGEYTWYKLVEWLQVQYVELFGSSLQAVPWYRFPFGEMMKKYFQILFEEMKIVYSKHGLVKAGLSKAFLTDFIPGIVMSSIFSQLGLMAMPLRFSLGDEYSEEDEATQYEQVILATKDEVEDIDDDIVVTNLVPGLYILSVPSMGKFTKALKKIASVGRESKVLAISSHTEIQMKVSVDTRQESHLTRLRLQLEQIEGVSVLFNYSLPLTATEEDAKTHYCLCVEIPHLLQVIRQIEDQEAELPNPGHHFQIEQIYDFWN